MSIDRDELRSRASDFCNKNMHFPPRVIALDDFGPLGGDKLNIGPGLARSFSCEKGYVLGALSQCKSTNSPNDVTEGIADCMNRAQRHLKKVLTRWYPEQGGNVYEHYFDREWCKTGYIAGMRSNDAYAIGMCKDSRHEVAATPDPTVTSNKGVHEPHLEQGSDAHQQLVIGESGESR